MPPEASAKHSETLDRFSKALDRLSEASAVFEATDRLSEASFMLSKASKALRSPQGYEGPQTDIRGENKNLACVEPLVIGSSGAAAPSTTKTQQSLMGHRVPLTT